MAKWSHPRFRNLKKRCKASLGLLWNAKFTARSYCFCVLYSFSICFGQFPFPGILCSRWALLAFLKQYPITHLCGCADLHCNPRSPYTSLGLKGSFPLFFLVSWTICFIPKL
ncbi:rCG33859 [Rattus norvegicus]|uniref:RCG33859 n=1 Tax=Rattus norvegicus TaxID=10116 RepID=A6HIX9_RAT|nr:rCG33859 [Rattus norvegicus]